MVYCAMSENSCLYILLGFLFVYGRVAIPVTVNPSRAEAEVLLPNL